MIDTRVEFLDCRLRRSDIPRHITMRRFFEARQRGGFGGRRQARETLPVLPIQRLSTPHSTFFALHNFPVRRSAFDEATVKYANYRASANSSSAGRDVQTGPAFGKGRNALWRKEYLRIARASPDSRPSRRFGRQSDGISDFRVRARCRRRGMSVVLSFRLTIRYSSAFAYPVGYVKTDARTAALIRGFAR